MKVATQSGRLSLVIDGHLVDVEKASAGAVASDPAGIYEAWDELRALAGRIEDVSTYPPVDESSLERPIPVPRQAFGVGLNYNDHAAESGMELPKTPMIFPKFSSCIAGPNDVLRSNASDLDWEAELVVVIGRDCFDVSPADAWDVVAGLTVGQDFSDRIVQFEGGATPQMGLGKSAPGFGPVGPWVVSTDEFPRELDLDIRCEVNGETKQHSSTRNLIFDVPTLVSYLSRRVQLLAGDVIFTGTPEGVGWGRRPQEFLAADDVVTTTIEGIGTITTLVQAR